VLSHDAQPAVFGLQFDAQPDEVAVDLGVKFMKLAGRKIGGIRVQGIGRTAKIFPDRRRRRQPQALLCQLGGHGHRLAGIGTAGYDPHSYEPTQLIAQGVDLLRVGLGQMILKKNRLFEGHFQLVGAFLDQMLPMGWFHVVGLDLAQHLVVEFQRPGRRDLFELAAKRLVGITPRQIVVHAHPLESPAQARIVRIAPQGVFIVRQRLAPAALKLELMAAAQKIENLLLRIDNGDRGGGLLGDSGRRNTYPPTAQQAEPSGQQEGGGPAMHDFVRG